MQQRPCAGGFESLHASCSPRLFQDLSEPKSHGGCRSQKPSSKSISRGTTAGGGHNWKHLFDGVPAPPPEMPSHPLELQSIRPGGHVEMGTLILESRHTGWGTTRLGSSPHPSPGQGHRYGISPSTGCHIGWTYEELTGTTLTNESR